MVNTAGHYQLAEPYFGTQTIHLEDQEDSLVFVRAVTERYSVKFDLDVEYEVGSKRYVDRLTDNGRPFALTAYRCDSTGIARYKRLFGLDAKPTYGMYESSNPTFYCR
jgi:hypothetical protein